MYLSIIILPLLGSIVSGFFGRKVGVSGAQLVASSSVIITTILAIITFFEVGYNNNPVFINLFRWIDSGWLNVIWGFQFDSLTVSMTIPVLIISSLVHIYSISYMSNDPHIQRFFSYLSLFTFMMIILVTADNYLLMFVGWEGVGVCSYLLVSFWFTRIAANQSSMSAFLTNRVGDCLLVLGMFAIFWSLGNLDYATVFTLAPYINENIVTIVGICILVGAMAKSSQVGLHIWLPMAMEGPTPVSALIHAATMVTAGVYLLMRSSPFIEYSSTLLLLCLWLGAITTVFSSLIGLFQQDIKKVIAYSTMSQLGMMVIAVGLSSYNIALFHLINHAFYKGLLFLGAGAVIHAVADNQDFRKYGGLISFLPLTYSVMLIASLSLVAFPFMTGFYSKDFILESAYGQYCYSSITVYIVAVIGAIFTTLYSVKVLYLTFLTNPNGSLSYYKHAHEGDLFLSLPLFILAIFSIFFGFITKDIFIGLGSNFFADNSLFIHPIHEIMIDTEFAVPTLFKLLPLIFTILFSIMALIFSEFLSESIINFKLSRLGYNIFGFFNQRFLIEFYYNKYIVNLFLNLGSQTTKILDKGSIELIGPYGLETILTNYSKSINRLNTSTPTDYSLYLLTGIIFYVLIHYNYNLDYSFLLLVLSFVNLLSNNKYNNSENSNCLEASLIFTVKRCSFSTTSCRNESEDDSNSNSESDWDPKSEDDSDFGASSKGGTDSNPRPESNPRTESNQESGSSSDSGSDISGFSGLGSAEKDTIGGTMTQYEKDNPGPSFKNPGYPDFSKIEKSARSHEEFHEQKGKFLRRHSTVHEAREHDERVSEFVVDQTKRVFPYATKTDIREEVAKRQAGRYETEGSYEGFTKSEAKWIEKTDYRALDYGKDYPIDNFSLPSRSDTSPGTPSVAHPPTDQEALAKAELDRDNELKRLRDEAETETEEEKPKPKRQKRNDDDDDDDNNSGGSSGIGPNGYSPSNGEGPSSGDSGNVYSKITFYMWGLIAQVADVIAEVTQTINL